MNSFFASHRQIGTHYYVSETDARASSAKCRACNAPVLFIKTAAGKNMPLDVAAGELTDSGELKCVSHFATCPKSAQFREPKKPKPKTACPVTSCAGTVRDGELLCSTCWRQVPKRLRDEVMRTWDLAKGGPREAYRTYESSAKAALASANAAKAESKVKQIDAFGSSVNDPG